MIQAQNFGYETPFVTTKQQAQPSTPQKCQPQPQEMKLKCARKLNYDFPLVQQKNPFFSKETPYSSPITVNQGITPSTASSLLFTSEQRDFNTPNTISKFQDKIFNAKGAFNKNGDIGLASFQKSILFESFEDIETIDKGVDNLQVIKSQFIGCSKQRS